MLSFSHFFLRPVRSLVSQLKTSNQVMLNIWWISNDCFTLLNLPTDSQRKQLDARSNGKRRRPPSIVGPRKPFFGSGASTSDLCALGRWLSKDVPAKNKKIAGIRENFFFILPSIWSRAFIDIATNQLGQIKDEILVHWEPAPIHTWLRRRGSHREMKVEKMPIWN